MSSPSHISAYANDADNFLSRRVPHENSSTLSDRLSPILKFRKDMKKDGRPYADLAFADPHDPPLYGLTRALSEQAARGVTTAAAEPCDENDDDCPPSSLASLFQYQREFKVEKQAILEALQRRRGHSYDSLTAHHIWITNGGFGGLIMAMKTFSNVGDIFVTVTPEYFAYQDMIEGLECSTITVPLSPDDDFDLNVVAIDFALRHHIEQVRILLLTSPGHPSGHVYTTEKLQALALVLQTINREREKHHFLPPIILLADEAYHRIVFPSTHRPYVSPASFYEYTVSVYSYAKTTMAPSERLGWLALSPLWPKEMIRMTQKALDAAQRTTGWLSPSATHARCIPALERRQEEDTHKQHHRHHKNNNQHHNSSISSLNSSSQHINYYDPNDGVHLDMHELEERRDQLVSTLSSHGIHNVFPHVINPQSGLYMQIRVPDLFLPSHDADFCKLLAERYRIIAIPGSLMGLPGWIRFAITAPQDMMDHTCAGIHAFALDYKSNDPALEPWLPAKDID